MYSLISTIKFYRPDLMNDQNGDFIIPLNPPNDFLAGNKLLLSFVF